MRTWVLVVGALASACSSNSRPEQASKRAPASGSAASMPSPDASPSIAAPLDANEVTMPVPAHAETLPLYYNRSPTFPNWAGGDSAGRPTNVAALDHLAALSAAKREMVIAVQRDPSTETPTFADVYPIGVIVRITKLARHGADNIEFEWAGVIRARVFSIDTTGPAQIATIARVDATGKLAAGREQELDALLRRDLMRLKRHRKVSDSDLVDNVIQTFSLGTLGASAVAELLQELDVDRRAVRLIAEVEAVRAQREAGSP